MSSDEPTPLDTQPQDLFLSESAAIKLQYFWRKRLHLTTVRLVRQHMNMGVTTAYATSVYFEDLVAFIRDDTTKSVAKTATQRIFMLTTSRHGLPLNPALGNPDADHDGDQDGAQDDAQAVALNTAGGACVANVRIFLAAYMIAFHPTRVFEEMDVLEQTVADSAINLIVSFETICHRILFSETGSFAEVPHDLTADFPTLFVNYFHDFNVWKVPDAARLATRIRRALLALYQAVQTLPSDEPEDSPLRIEFTTQIARLRTKMLQICGEGALADLDAERINHIPPTPPAQGLDEALPPPPAVQTHSPIPPRLSNEQMALAILIDGDFIVEDDDDDTNGARQGSVSGEMRERLHRAFWESLEHDLSQPTPLFTRALRVLEEVHTALSTIPETPLPAQEAVVLNEAINIEHIRTQAEAGLFSWESCVRLVAAVVGVANEMLDAARRGQTLTMWAQISASLDEATINAQLRPRALSGALKFLLNRINAMRADFARARVRLVAPVVRENGIEYLRGKFQDSINAGTLTLQRTTAWINKVVHDKPNIVNALIEGRETEALHLHHEAILWFVTSKEVCITDRGTRLPETLLQLTHRINDMNLAVHFLTRTATLLSMVHSAGPPPWAVIDHIAARVIREVDPAAMEDRITPIIVAELAPHVNAAVLRNTQRLMQMARNPLNGLHQLMLTRMTRVLRSMVLTGAPPENIDPIINRILPRIRQLTTEFVKMSSINHQVHLPTYTRLILEAAQGLQANV